MSRQSMLVAVFIGVFCCSILNSSITLAADHSGSPDSAKELLDEALVREVYGLSSERNELLQRVAVQFPSYRPAKWHQGLVWFLSEWRTPQVIAQLIKQPWWDEYISRRDQTQDTASGQIALADWCREQGLSQQSRAHLIRALDFDPDNPDVLWRLGIRTADGRWSDNEHARSERVRRQESIAKWSFQVGKLGRGLNSTSHRQRNMAQRNLREIKDRSAVPALENMLATESERSAQLLVEILNEINGHEAALSLARQAALSPWSEVRHTAAQRLRSRKPDGYVPAMLAAMQMPITTRTMAYRDRGRVSFVHSIVREGQDEKERMIVQSSRPALGRAEKLHKENLKTETVNVRISRALNIALDEQVPADPQAWWNWWNDRNEVYVEGEKPVRNVDASNQLARVERFRELDQDRRIQEARRWAERRSQFPGSQRSRYRKDCLAAGTSVWTIAGPLAIENVQVGDLVLSQHPETGELTYKAVLRTTIRPATVLVKIQAANGTIQASGGHPFWTSGEGWVKARDLEPGMELHGIRGTTRIRDVQDGDEELSYNLIVADFHTYFVGQACVLNHDNTVRRPTDAIVPGLIAY